MNSCSFVGRVGAKDAVTRFTQAGKAVTGWSIAVDSGFGDNKSTVWLDCTLWGDRGEKLAPMILKGDRIGVTGELGTREHDGKTYVTLKVADVTLLGNKKTDQESRQARSEPLPAHDDFADDDIPFG